jgi:16S rRNA (cytosine967-C5)-methyltransferase
MRPASLAQGLGVGLAPGEPWSLNSPALAHWRPAVLMGSRLYELLISGVPAPDPIREDFPSAMLEEWERDWGPETTDRLVNRLGGEAPLSLRARADVGAAEVVRRLKEGNTIPVRVERSKIAPFGVRLNGYAPVLGTPLFKEGAFEIQDEGSQLMALLALWPELVAPALSLTPAPAEPPPEIKPPRVSKKALTVIDTCAGAGGKTLALADALGGGGRVFAYDTSEPKLQALRRRATHAGLRNIRAVALTQGKEEASIEPFAGKADVVLVDAPCSGWGVLRRNPDIKWRQAADAVARMPAIQSRLLSLYSPLVKPGGRLVFGVCTFRKAETLEIVSRFLEEHRDFTPGPGGFVGPGSSDGFFMQVLTRQGP